MRTITFQIPDHDLQALVCVYDSHATIAFRAESHHTWGVPIVAATDDDSRWQHSDLDAGPRPLPDHMRGRRL